MLLTAAKFSWNLYNKSLFNIQEKYLDLFVSPVDYRKKRDVYDDFMMDIEKRDREHKERKDIEKIVKEGQAKLNNDSKDYESRRRSRSKDKSRSRSR